jgi:hypothetical protein
VGEQIQWICESSERAELGRGAEEMLARIFGLAQAALT